MIRSLSSHQRAIEVLKEKAFHSNFNVVCFAEHPLVNIKNEADILFTNLNVSHVLDNITFQPQSSFYKEVIFNQLLNELDLQYHYQYLVNEVIEIRGISPTDDQPKIYCSFHFGAYLQISSALRILDKKFAVISNTISGQDLVQWDKTETKTQENIDYFEDFEVINPFEMKAIFRMYNLLKKGKSILVYLDGLQGKIGKGGRRDKAVALLKARILLSSGIPEISSKCSVPLVPVIAERSEEHKITISFYEPVCKGETFRKEYVGEALQECVDVFSVSLKKNPAQWQEWPFVHKKLIQPSGPRYQKTSPLQYIKKYLEKPKKKQKQKIETTSVLEFNQRNYQIFTREEQHYVININNYFCFKISKNLRMILEHISGVDFAASQVKAMLNHSLYTDLVENEILIIKEGQ